MKKVLLTLTIVFMAFGQTPNFTSSNPNVRISLMAYMVNITSNRASVNCEIHFKNDGQREAEAELTLPLPEGVSVSRYYLDINGVMREAVPVRKDKGKQVFEALEHKRVDPGLLEKVETGNSFRTRVYPLPAGGTRKIIIGYDQQLDNLDGSYIYKVLSEYSKPVESYSLSINVMSEAGPSIQADDDEDMTLKLANGTYHYNMSKKDYVPKRTLTVRIPSQKSSTITKLVQGTLYFYTVVDTSALVSTTELIDEIPQQITLIWDDSLSTKHRNIEDELKFLDEYFSGHSSKVTLYSLNYQFAKKDEFIVTNGKWLALRKVLSESKYDGGTRFSQIQLQQKSTILFFTDGISSLSNSTFALPKDTVLNTISSAPTVDHAYLNYVSNLNSGVYINLKSLTPSQGARMLKTKSIRFQGIEETALVNEVYPLKGTPVTKSSFSISGISLTPVTLLFGPSSDSIVKRIPVDIGADTSSAIIDVEKVWAARKVQSLQYDYSKNKEKIENIGKRFSIVTRGTSLIVLETVQDYIKYGIVPPQELREQFDRLGKQYFYDPLSTKISNWHYVESSLVKLINWWEGQRGDAVNKNSRLTDEDMQRLLREAVPFQERGTDEDIERIRRRVLLQQERYDALLLQERATQASAQAESDQLNIQRASTINSSRQGQFRVAAPNDASKKSDAHPTPLSKSNKDDGSTNVTRILSNQHSSVANSDSTIYNKEILKLDEERTQKKEDKQRLFSSSRSYMKSIVEASDKYKAYLELRELNENNPAFYIDVAIYLFESDRALALKILSSIAELSLENHYIYKTLTYLFKQFGSKEDCLYTATKVAIWRPFEPQAHRDLALALELNGRIEEAATQLVKALGCSFHREMTQVYQNVESVILLDIDRMVSEHNSSIFEGKLNPEYYSTRLPLDLRIILNWNQMDVDIDLQVVEPNKEKCYFAQRQTDIGGRFFVDFREGYGPQQYTLKKAIEGKYILKTNYFGDRKLTDSGPVTIQVEIYQRQPDGSISKKYRTVTSFQTKGNQEIAIVEFK